MARRNSSFTQRIAITVAVIVGRRVVRRQLKKILDDLLPPPEPEPRSAMKKVGVGVAAVAVAATAAAAAAVWFGRDRAE